MRGIIIMDTANLFAKQKRNALAHTIHAHVIVYT